jgi:DNA-binding transcriptional LysR family regulator
VDRLEAMRLLITAVETGSFSAAARKLGVPLPTLSRKIGELEKHLSARLLTRSTRKLSLTDAGAAYVATARRILDQVSEAERSASGEYVTPRGELVITAPIVLGRLHVLPIVCDFLSEFPEINVRLALSDRFVHLQDHQIDMAVRIGELPDSSLVATRVGTVSRVVCASPRVLAKQGTPKTPDALTDLPCIQFEGVSGNAWHFAAQTVLVRLRLSVNTAEAAVDAAIAGVGFTQVLSYQAARAVQEGTLKLVLRKFEPPPMPVSLVHGGQGTLPLKMRRFLDYAAPRLRKALSGEKRGDATSLAD